MDFQNLCLTLAPYKTPIIFLLAVITLIIIIKICALQRKKVICKNLFTIGFSNDESSKGRIIDELVTFPLFGGTRLYNKIGIIFKGNYGSASWYIFDFESDRNRDGRPNYGPVTTVAYAQINSNLFPQFIVSRRTILDNFLERDSRSRSIMVTDNVEFSNKFTVNSIDESAVKKLFTPLILSTLQKIPGWITITAEGNKFLYYKFGKVAAKDMLVFVKEASNILELLIRT